jgi:serine/threonine protein kinase
MIPQQVSHYRIVGQIGAGGMGVVYEAEDTRLGRAVALKFLPASVHNDEAAWERFRREARAASALNHPNICTVHEMDEADGLPFIVMELLVGETLARRVAGRALLPIDDLLAISTQLVDALDAAHAQGILHRDIKPANVFITTRGQVKVLDFGLAKKGVSDVAVAGVTVSAAPHATNPGTALGTLAYMSPEQRAVKKLTLERTSSRAGPCCTKCARAVCRFPAKRARSSPTAFSIGIRSHPAG